MYIEVNNGNFAEVMHKYEEWIGDLNNSEVRGLIIGWLKALAELPVYEPGDPGRVREGSHAYEGCQTVDELLGVIIARKMADMEDCRSMVLETVLIQQVDDYFYSNLYVEWLTKNKDQALAIVGDDYEEFFDDPLELWQTFVRSGDLQLDTVPLQAQVDDLSRLTMDELWAAEGTCPLSQERLVSELIY